MSYLIFFDLFYCFLALYLCFRNYALNKIYKRYLCFVISSLQNIANIKNAKR